MLGLALDSRLITLAQIMAGGTAKAFELALLFLKAMGSTISVRCRDNPRLSRQKPRARATCGKGKGGGREFGHTRHSGTGNDEAATRRSPDIRYSAASNIGFPNEREFQTFDSMRKQHLISFKRRLSRHNHRLAAQGSNFAD